MFGPKLELPSNGTDKASGKRSSPSAVEPASKSSKTADAGGDEDDKMPEPFEAGTNHKSNKKRDQISTVEECRIAIVQVFERLQLEDQDLKFSCIVRQGRAFAPTSKKRKMTGMPIKIPSPAIPGVICTYMYGKRCYQSGQPLWKRKSQLPDTHLKKEPLHSSPSSTKTGAQVSTPSYPSLGGERAQGYCRMALAAQVQNQLRKGNGLA